MSTYINKLSDALFPFVLHVPFPIGCISNLSICTSNNSTIYVTSITSAQNKFILTVAGLQCFCSFEYKDNLIIQSSSLKNMSGILSLSHIPKLVFSYTGRWKIHRRCVQTKVSTGGYTQILINGVEYDSLRTLDIVFKGAVLINKENVQPRRADDTIIPQRSPFYVKSINGLDTHSLNIKSSDASITVSRPLTLGGTVVLYINTSNRFPTCSEV